MKKFLQTLAVLTLIGWGALFLYFYGSGRIEKYLDPSFRIYALVSGIGLILLAAFNFLNRHRDTGVCTHDHAHGEPCGHDHHHHHDHGDECCGHDHDDHHRSHSDCGHDHGNSHAHSHGHGCCGHDHHDHEDDEESHGHVHDHEETTSGLLFSLIVLILPMLVATAYSHDKFSSEYLAKWGKIERQMMQMRIAERRGSAPANSTTSPDNPYTQAGIDAATGKAADPATTTAGSGDAGQAWGTFTLEDLKKMVPQNEKGEFLLDVPQIFYTAGDKELMQVMEGIPVETTAQLMEETLHNPDNTRLKAFRLFIECCAADARPLSIPIDFGKAPPEYTEMGWYKIYGKLHYSHENEEIIPLLQIERIEATSEPTDGLLF